ncbi:ribonuclease HII [Companilactobacillus crustorum]|uniref:Ribonuclease HII n=3 Tax=Companilactobacillus TaxID=2767879 RepID=A0A837RF56_9LACO|nr:ribonuclease HII [Companilactobacillus crustorum]KRK41452.1 ribonuclease HII (RNase HII) [Companilactobacillus crustorum JCM 15951]KRO19113.1 ribonuclease HII (RNase HII) [Companilactobacillus crustorum]GEO77316.1 ribonuclease HII [Companilactobacillus crustorum]
MKNKYTIKDIKEILVNQTPSDEILQELSEDTRAGVKKLLVQYQQRQIKQQALIAKFHQKEFLEKPFWDHDLLVAGVDEVGRGPLAGPVVTAAVILPAQNTLYEVDDSKKLSAIKRSELYRQICEQAIDISVAIGSPQLIDTENIYHATELTMGDSINRLYVKPNHILVDAMTIPVAIPQTKLIKGDAKSLSIGAASIVAKVARDRLMTMYSHLYPEFGFERNDGYGTKEHLLALEQFGRTKIHRLSFSPVRKVNNLYSK